MAAASTPTFTGRSPSKPPHPVRPGRRWPAAVRLHPAVPLLVLSVLASLAARLPFLHAPLTSDESGFLIVARQWGHGSSLYGDYWVDRPPLLLWLFSLAGHLGGVDPSAAGATAPGLKLLGAGAAGTAVLAAGVLALLVVPTPRARAAATALAAVLVSSPLLGMPEIDGEVLALPFVLSGLVFLVGSLRQTSPRQAGLLAAAAGAAGMAAALVKQNTLDVLVFAAGVWLLGRSGTGGILWRQAVAFVAGAVAVLAAVVAAAAAKGTPPGALWDAVVAFRVQAARTIEASASPATSDRLLHLVLAFLGSGVAVILVVTAWAALSSSRRRRHALRPRAAGRLRVDLTWPALAMVTWELFGVAMGGSYWLHYLTGLVPGVVLLVAMAAGGAIPGRLLRVALAYAVLANVAGWTYLATSPVRPSPDAEVASYLRHHAGRSDGVVVAFGHPDIVAGSGLTSPYSELWSLPVRVRDPRLRELRRVMAGPRAPRWMVVDGAGIGSWGLHAQAAQRRLAQRYTEQATYGEWHVWRRDGSGPRAPR